MKQEVLALLGSRDEYVSGQNICEQLAKSRTAVWHAVQELRDLGYVIEASPRKGYRLISRPDRIFPWEVAPYLTTRKIGRPLQHHMSVGSTNDLAKQAGKNGAPEGLVIVAEEQTEGKGRRGRNWISPPGLGIWSSTLLRPNMSPYEAPKMALAAALAAAGAIEDLTGLDAGVKWPNDVLVHGKKVSGILVEMDAELDQVRYLVVGIGINANLLHDDLPEEVRGSASSLKIISGESVNRPQLLAQLLNRLESIYLTWQDKGFASILDQLRRRTVTLGQEVMVLEHKASWPGIARDIAPDGSLLVETSDGTIQPVYAADVTIRSHTS